MTAMVQAAEALVLRFPWYLAAIPPAIALLLLGIGLLRRRRGRSGVVWLAFGAAVGALFGPMLLNDRIVVDQQGIDHTTGFWFAPNHRGFRFDDVHRIAIRSVEQYRGRSRSRSDVWMLTHRGGDVEQFDPGDLWHHHQAVLIAACEARGIRFE